jgi:hypothetical protein
MENFLVDALKLVAPLSVPCIVFAQGPATAPSLVFDLFKWRLAGAGEWMDGFSTENVGISKRPRRTGVSRQYESSRWHPPARRMTSAGMRLRAPSTSRLIGKLTASGERPIGDGAGVTAQNPSKSLRRQSLRGVPLPGSRAGTFCASHLSTQPFGRTRMRGNVR